MRGFGRIYRRGATWWVEYWHRGRQYRESSGSTRDVEARRLLKRRLGEAGSGRFVGPREERVLLTDLLDAVETDYQLNSRRSLRTLQIRLRTLRAAFVGVRALDVTDDSIERYRAARLAEGRAPATVNRELAVLRRAFRLALRQRRLSTMPTITLVAEHNARQGFFEEAEFRAVLAHLPEDVKPVAEFMYLTGWRIGEVLLLRWHQIDFHEGEVRLEPGTTKNDDGREFPFAALPPLGELLRRQRERTAAVEKTSGRIIPWVFHRAGEPIKSIRGAWNKAVMAAGLVGRIPHDFRRTAVRNLERAGVPRSVAMKLTGHKTESVYRRYAIVSKADLREGVAKLAALHGNSDVGTARTIVSIAERRAEPSGRRREPAQFPHNLP